MKGEPLYRKRLHFLVSMISSWLAEVEGEVTEAVGILSESDGSGQWWAERIRRRLLEDSPPDPSMVKSDDQPATLIEIAFWSGWLRGELDTLRRCSLTLQTVAASQSGQLKLPLDVLPSQVKSEHPVNYWKLKMSAEHLIERIDAHNSLPGAELVSIHLSEALGLKGGRDSDSLEAECFLALSEHLADNSMNSLVRLAFDSGILAGLMIRERDDTGESTSRSSKGGRDRRTQ